MLLYYNNKEYLDRQYETDDDDSLDIYDDVESEEWFRELLESEFNDKKGE